MNRPTLGTFRAQWPAEAMGACQADPRVRDYCNDAQQRLLMDPMAPEEGWWGGWVTMNFTASVSNGAAYVTTPREVGRLTALAVCQHPIHIRNGFYEYLKWGAGLQPKTCRTGSCGSTFQAIERDSVPTLSPLLAVSTIRVYPTDSRDTGRRVLLQGKDNNGMPILTTDPGTGKSASGEYLQLKLPFADSLNTFSSITGIQKDETWGMVQFFAVDPATGLEIPLSSMEPSEAQAWYRRYAIVGVPHINLCCPSSSRTSVQLTAQAKLDFIPVENETDYLIIQNIPALIEESKSIRFGNMDSSDALQQSLLHHGRALQYLNGQLDEKLGKVNTAVRVPIFGGQRLRRQLV